MASIFPPFPFQAMSPGLWPPSSPCATSRPASPSWAPFPGSPQTGQQSSGPHRPPGLGEDGPQDLRILSAQPLALSPSRLSSSPAAPQLQASCQPTCTQLRAHRPQEDLQRARLPLCPRPFQPAGGPASPDGPGPPSLSLSPSPNPSPVPTENYSCESPQARSSGARQLPTQGKFHLCRVLHTQPGLTGHTGRSCARGLALEVHVNSCGHGQALWG